MMYDHGHGMTAWGYGFMAISMVLFWSVVVLVGALAVRSYARSRRTNDGLRTQPVSTPIDVHDELVIAP